MTSLLDLPLELVEQIISILAEEKPPSAKLLHEEPSDSLLRSGHHTLKDLSQACRATRKLCFPSLFSAVKVDLDSMSGFLSFAESHSLSSHVDSLVLYTDRKSQADKFIYVPSSSPWLPMVRVVNSVRPSLMTVILPPLLFAHVLPYQPNLDHEWAFSTAYQVLQLKTPRDLAPSSQISQHTIESRDIFRLRPWTHCTFNQGSSVKSYSSYEYFLKQTPSIFNPGDFDELVLRTMRGSFEILTSIDYTAVFPVDYDILQFCRCMCVMKSLKCLRVQLSPTRSNDVLDNPAALGKSPPRDLWQEFESCYSTFAHYVCMKRDDWAMSFGEFVSLDYVNPSLRELIDRAAGQGLVEWDFDPDDGRWTWREERPKEPSH